MMRCCGKSGAPPQHEEQTPEMFFPMWVLPMATVLAMSGAPKSFQELQDEGKLVKWQLGMFTVFLSHQWLGFGHADPQGTQLEVLRKALRNIFSGRITVQSESTMLAYFGKVEVMQPAQIARLQDAYVWFDWWSIPQITVRRPSDSPDMGSDVQKAVTSIPAYVAAADCFVVLSPEAEHHNSSETCNFGSWESRGWCRVELLAAMFSTAEARKLIAVSSPTFVHYIFPSHYLNAAPGRGNFAVAADRVPLYGVVSQIIDMHLENLRGRGEHKIRSRVLTATRRRFLQGLGTAEQRARAFDPNRETVEAFCRRFGFSSLLELPASGFGPVHCAAIEGSLPILRQLAAARANLNQGTRVQKPQLMMQRGETPLTMAVMLNGDVAVVQCLLELRADIKCQNAVGYGLLHYCAANGRSDLLEFLIARGLDPNSAPSTGDSPLLCAAAADQPGPMEVLLRHGAKASSPWCTGVTPLQVSAMGGHLECCRLLLQHHADVNDVARATSLLGSVINRGCRLSLPLLGSMGKAGPLYVMAVINGSTALIVAAALGRLGVVQLLLESRADPAAKNEMGLDALTLATEHGHEAVAALLQLHKSHRLVSV